MKKILATICYLMFSCLFMGSFHYALANPDEGAVNVMLDKVGQKANYTQLATEDFEKHRAYPALVGRFIGVFLGVVGVIFTVLLVYSGYLWFTAQGDATALSKSKEIMTRAIVGLIIVVSAYVITYFVTTAISNGYFI